MPALSIGLLLVGVGIVWLGGMLFGQYTQMHRIFELRQVCRKQHQLIQEVLALLWTHQGGNEYRNDLLTRVAANATTRLLVTRIASKTEGPLTEIRVVTVTGPRILVVPESVLVESDGRWAIPCVVDIYQTLETDPANCVVYTVEGARIHTVLNQILCSRGEGIDCPIS